MKCMYQNCEKLLFGTHQDDFGGDFVKCFGRYLKRMLKCMRSMGSRGGGFGEWSRRVDTVVR